MTIITPTGITGINSITSSGSTLVFQSASGASPTVSGLNNISSSGIITATGFVGNLTGNVNSSGVSTIATLNVTQSNPTNLNVSGISTFAAGSASAPSITPTGDSNTGIFFPAADTIAFAEGGIEAARLDSSGRLGVGTNNPQSKLHVGGSSPHAFIQGNYNSTAVTDHSRIYFNDFNFGIGCGNFGSVTDDDLYLWAFNGTGRDIKFCTTTDGSSSASSGFWTTNMIIKNDGKIGIGVTNPSSTVVVRGDNNAGVGAVLSLQNRGGTSAGTLTGISFGVDTSDAVIGGGDSGNAAITVENSGTSNQAIMKFRVFDNADSEAMKICGNGVGFTPAEGGDSTIRNGVAFANAGVAIDKGWASFPGIMVFNTNAYGSTTQSEFRIHGWNRSYASYPGTSGADFGVNLRIDGSTYFSSDARHKTNIVDNPYGLNEVLQLQPRKFNRINSEGQIEENQGDILGFIAQEVKEVIPEAVNYYPSEDNPNEIGWCRAYSLCDGYIVSTLVNAVKEQNSIIETLISRIESLESQINT
jgi:hypothetical protein